MCPNYNFKLELLFCAMCLPTICLKLSGIRLHYALFLFYFFSFGWIKIFYSSHTRISSSPPSTIIKTQNPSSPSIYSSPLLQLMLWNFKRISQYQWCIPLGISVSYIGRGSPSIPIVLFFTILMVLHLFRLYFSSQF